MPKTSKPRLPRDDGRPESISNVGQFADRLQSPSDAPVSESVEERKQRQRIQWRTSKRKGRIKAAKQTGVAKQKRLQRARRTLQRWRQSAYMLPFVSEPGPEKQSPREGQAARGRRRRPIVLKSAEEMTEVTGTPLIEFSRPSRVEITRAMGLAAFGVPLSAFDPIALRAFVYFFWEGLWKFGDELRYDARRQKLGRCMREQLLSRIHCLESKPIALLSELLFVGLYALTEVPLPLRDGTLSTVERGETKKTVQERAEWLRFIYPALGTFMAVTGAIKQRETLRVVLADWGWPKSDLSPITITSGGHDYPLVFGAIAKNFAGPRDDEAPELQDAPIAEPLAECTSDAFGDGFALPQLNGDGSSHDSSLAIVSRKIGGEFG